MAVVENAGLSVGSSSRSFDAASQESGGGPSSNGHDQARHGLVRHRIDPHHDQGLYIKTQQSFDVKIGAHRSNGGDSSMNGDAGESFNRDMRELQELFSKLNPMAEEFVPPSLANNGGFYGNGLVMHGNDRNGFANGNNGRRVCMSLTLCLVLEKMKDKEPKNDSFLGVFDFL